MKSLRRSAYVAKMVLTAYRGRMRLAAGRIGSSGGDTHRNYDVGQSTDYIRRVFNDYLRYGSLDETKLNGKTILEFGPGDNLGVALLFLAHGARKVTCLDQFYVPRDPQRELSIYSALRNELPAGEQARFDAAVRLNAAVSVDPEKLQTIYGAGAHDADKVLAGRQFDFIVSRAVLEECHRIDAVFAAMDKLLLPGGMLIHKVDLTDYGIFSGRGYHPLEFLTFPAPLYRAMTWDTERPNRRMLNYYRAKMTQLGYDAQLFVTAINDSVGGYPGSYRSLPGLNTSLMPGVDYEERHRELLSEIRPRLADEFRNSPDEELLAAGLFLVAKKAAG